MHKKYHEKFKILDILAVTTQAHEGIETFTMGKAKSNCLVTTQAHEGIETLIKYGKDKTAKRNNSSP